MGAAACLTTCCLPRHGGDNHKVLPWGETHTASHAAYSNRFIHQGRADDMAKFHARLCQVWLQHETPKCPGGGRPVARVCASAQSAENFLANARGRGAPPPGCVGGPLPKVLRRNLVPSYDVKTLCVSSCAASSKGQGCHGVE